MKVKLQKQFSYEYNGKRHFKHVLIVPDDAVKELGWNGGQDLEIRVEKGQLIAEVKKAEKKRLENIKK